MTQYFVRLTQTTYVSLVVVITAGFETFILEPSMHYINTNSWCLGALMWFNPYSGNSRSLVLGSKIQFKLTNPSSIHHGIQFHYDQFPFWIKTISTAYVPSYCKFSNDFGFRFSMITYLSHVNTACDNVIVTIIIWRSNDIINSDVCCVRPTKLRFQWSYGKRIFIEKIHDNKFKSFYKTVKTVFEHSVMARVGSHRGINLTNKEIRNTGCRSLITHILYMLN